MEKLYQKLMKISIFKKISTLPVLGKLFTYEALVYIFFGAVTTFVNWITYLFVKQVLQQSTAFSNTAAWIIAVLFAYGVNKVYVFKSHQSSIGGLLREFGLFIAARLLSFGFDQAFMIITVDHLYFPDALAKILSNVFVLIMNYFASKIIIFKNKK
ncbi:MAG: GtrA family protein [Clostridiaceae bacterium]|nr:GtrA family protein [Clostridiaceae bacterium]